MANSIIIDHGLRGFILGGLLNDIFVLIWNFMNADKILRMIDNFKRTDDEVSKISRNFLSAALFLHRCKVIIFVNRHFIFFDQIIGAFSSYNNERRIILFMLTILICQLSFCGISIYMFSKFHSISALFGFYISCALFSSCFTGSMSFYNFF